MQLPFVLLFFRSFSFSLSPNRVVSASISNDWKNKASAFTFAAVCFININSCYSEDVLLYLKLIF